MLCHVCKKLEATYHQLDRLEDGSWIQRDLCEECYHAATGSAPVAKVTKKVLLETKIELGATSKEDDFACPGCGLAYSTFLKQRRLGCERCYQTFRSDVERIFRRVQQHTNHRGKVPGRPRPTEHAPAQLDELRSKLQRAIEEERFEDAALFRDKMRRMSEGRE